MSCALFDAAKEKVLEKKSSGIKIKASSSKTNSKKKKKPKLSKAAKHFGKKKKVKF
jgi:hypothetical protein